jgi:hypothetical protein
MMPKLDTVDEFERFRIERDSMMMQEALNELDPFVGHPPCYAKKSREIVTSAA